MPLTPKTDMRRRADEPIGMVHFACVLLHQAMVQACGRVLGIEVRARNALSLRSNLPWLKRKMLIEGWCPYTIWKLYAISDIDELVYGYALGTVRTKQDHSRCTSEICVANNAVNEAAPKHVRDGEPEDCTQVYAPLEDMLSIIREGGVPVLRIETDDCHRLSLSARRLDDPRVEYIALSHVWIDGMGSTTSNSIAQCQLVRLADRLGKLEATERCGELCFWMDTLCIPVDPQFQDHRDKQLQRMHDIYMQAYAVLVIDADTLAMRDTASMEEDGMRLYMSAWSSRLWTYQEGSLNKRLLVMASDGIIDLDARISRSMARDDRKDPLAHKILDQVLRATVGLGRPHYDSSPAPGTAKSAQVFYQSTDRIRRDGDHDAQNTLHAMRDRTSSRPDGEAIIIGSSLGLDVLPIIQAPPEQSMVALIKTMTHVPANLLCSPGLRCTQPGFRWAPQSVLRSKGGYAANAVRDLVPMNLEQVESHKEQKVRLMSKLDPEGRGLLSLNPGIRLKHVYSPPRVDHHRIVAFELMGKAHSFNGLDASFDDAGLSGQRTKEVVGLLDQGMQLAILLQEFDPMSRWYTGALVETPSESKPATEVGSLSEGATTARLIMLIRFAASIPEDVRAVVLAGKPEGTGRSLHEGKVSVTTQTHATQAGPYAAEWMTPRYWLVD